MNKTYRTLKTTHNSFELNKDPVFHIKKSKTCKFKTAFFKTLHLTWKSLHISRAQSLKQYLSYLLTIVRQVQILCLLLNHDKNSSSSLLFKFFSILQFDSYKIRSNSDDIFSTFSLVSTFFLLSCMTCLYFQVFFKRLYIVAPLIICINLLSFAVISALMVPILNNSLYYLRTNQELNEKFMNLEILKKFIFTLQFLGTCTHILLTNLFNYESDYVSYEPKARSCSLLTFKQEFFIILLCVFSNFLSDIYFLFFTIVIALYLLKTFLFTQPYYKQTENFIDCGLWMTVFTLAFLIVVEKLFRNSGQVVICFIFLTPLEYFLLSYYLNQVKIRILGQEIKNPYLLEQRIRKILYLNREVSEEDLEKIENLFEKATIEYLEYSPLWICECNFVIQVKENYALAAIKLLKILYSHKRPITLEKPQTTFKYPYSIEYEFQQYALAKALIKHEKFKDMLFVQYIKDLIHFKKLDSNACDGLLSVIDNYLLGNSVSNQEIESKLQNFNKIITLKDQFYEKFIKKYGNDQNFVELNLGFNVELMYKNISSSSVASSKTREFFIEKLTGDNNICNLATMILSGDPERLCTILYANDILISILKYPDEGSIVGVSFEVLFHDFFNTQKKSFINMLLLNNSCSITLSHMFILDFYGYAIEFSIDVKTTFLKGVCYFILNFQQEYKYLNYILITRTGSILTCSDQLKTIFTGFTKSIDEVLPGFMEILMNQEENKQFSYSGSSGLYLFQYTVLENEGENVFVLYTNEQEQSLSIKYPESPKMNIRRSLTFSGKILDDMHEMKRGFSMNRRKSRLSAEIVRNFKENYIDQSPKIKKISKILKVSSLVALTVLVFIYCAIILFYSDFVDDSKYLSIVNNIVTIRFTLVSALINLRSIDLLKKGVNCFASYEEYYKNIEGFNLKIGNWLEFLRGNQLNTESLFKEPKINLYSYQGDSITHEQVNLYQAVYILNQKFTELISKNFSDPNNLRFIYKNSFLSLQSQLNETIYKAVSTITTQALDLFIPVKILNILCLFPISFLFVLFLVNLYELQKLSNGILKKISSIHKKTFVLLRTRVIERIKKLHDSEFNLEYESLEVGIKNWPIWRKVSFYLFFLGISVIGYAFVVEYGFNKGFEDNIATRMKFRLIGGGRSVAGQSFLWAREAGLRNVGLGYLDMFDEFTEIYSEKSMNSYMVEKMRLVNDYWIDTSSKLNVKYDFRAYIDFIINDPCKELPQFLLCKESILAQGMSPAFNLQAADLEYFASLSEFNNEKLLQLEKNSNILLDYFGESLKVFEQCTDYLNYYKSLSVIIGLLVIFIVILYFYFFIYTEIVKIQNKILSINTLAKFFDHDKAQTDFY